MRLVTAGATGCKTVCLMMLRLKGDGHADRARGLLNIVVVRRPDTRGEVESGALNNEYISVFFPELGEGVQDIPTYRHIAKIYNLLLNFIPV